MGKKKIIEDWIKAFNEGNADKLAKFYHINAVNHQIANEPVKGKVAIKGMFLKEFDEAEMTCLIENLFEDGDWVILEWKDPLGLRGFGFFKFEAEKIIFQRGYWDKLSFLRQHNLPIPKN